MVIPAARTRVAFFDFTSCEGCQLTVIDSLQTHPELLDVIEIAQFREAMSEKDEDYQIAFIEGSCTRPSDEKRLQAIRSRADLVIALGACAHLGGVNAIRNLHDLADVRRYVYAERAERYETYPARPISAVIPIDGIIPGCPIDRDEFVRIVGLLLQGRAPELPDYPVCVECKLRETVCLYLRGGVCLGPVARAGCQAICPAYGDSCEACRGLIPHPNMKSLEAVLAEHGMSEQEVASRMTMFLTYQMQTADEEAPGHDNGHA